MDLIDRQEAMESFCDMRDGVPKVYGDEMYSDKDIVNTIKSLNKVDAVPLSVIDEIKAEIMEQFEGCDICQWDEDYDYEENNISEYKYIDSISSILKIIDEKSKGADR